MITWKLWDCRIARIKANIIMSTAASWPNAAGLDVCPYMYTSVHPQKVSLNEI